MKPQDIVVTIRLAQCEAADRTYPRLAAALGLSASEVHASVRRAVKSTLVDAQTRSIRKSALREFLVHGLRYVFPAEWVGVTRGVPTSYAAAPLCADIASGELAPVWPHPEGAVRGEGLKPLYKTVPDAALRDAALYEWLAIVEALRSGRARERTLASKQLERRLAP